MDKKLTYTTRHPSEKYTAENSFDRLWQHIQQTNNQEDKRRPLHLWRYVAVAASVAIIVLCATFIYNQQTKGAIYALNTGTERQDFTLPDGSKVWLNSESALTYTNAFGKDVRNVELCGEAYFEVAKDSTRPFIVKTGEISIKVLGTEFNVQAYPSEKTLTTTLLKGSVNVLQKFGPEGGIILCPGQQLLFYKSNKKMLVQNVDCTPYFAWKEGKLVFQQTNVKEAFAMIERDFRIKIILENTSLEGRKITGQFDLNEHPENILSVIQETLPFSYTMRNDTVFIK
jgi:ferric-dicitrate binding protein FerR (iron transport regulator)